MSPSHFLPTAAFAVAVGSLFAPPLLGAAGIAPAASPTRESALIIEKEPVSTVALAGPMSIGAGSRIERQNVQQCQADPAAARSAPLPPANSAPLHSSLRTVVAELGPARR